MAVFHSDPSLHRDFVKDSALLESRILLAELSSRACERIENSNVSGCRSLDLFESGLGQSFRVAFHDPSKIGDIGNSPEAVKLQGHEELLRIVEIGISLKVIIVHMCRGPAGGGRRPCCGVEIVTDESVFKLTRYGPAGF